MELITVALVALGYVAIFARFSPRDERGRIRLPRVVDDSIGMYALRQVTGRSLGPDPLEDAPAIDQRDNEAWLDDWLRSDAEWMARARGDRPSQMTLDAEMAAGSPRRHSEHVPGPLQHAVERYRASRVRLRAIGIAEAQPTPLVRGRPGWTPRPAPDSVPSLLPWEARTPRWATSDGTPTPG